MALTRTRVAEWYWAGPPGKRFLIGLAITLVIVGVPYIAGSPTSMPFIGFLLGWDFGAWFMEKMYVARKEQNRAVAI